MRLELLSVFDWSFRGRTVFEGNKPGRQALVGWLESDHESYRWLNDVVCIAEGQISDRGMEIHLYAGIPEQSPSLQSPASDEARRARRRAS